MAFRLQSRDAGRAIGLVAFQQVERQRRRQGIGDVTEIDSRYDLLGRHVGEIKPKRLAGALGQQVPDGVDDGGRGEMNDALFRAQPPILAVAHQTAPEAGKIILNPVKAATDDLRQQRVDRCHDKIGTAAQRERKAMAFQTICRQYDVSGGIVRVGVHCVRAVEKA